MPVVKVFCVQCRELLLRYGKRGTGALVKIHASRVKEDHTAPDRPFECPKCGSTFARELTIGQKIFRKLVGGKVFVKGGAIDTR